MSRLPKTEVGKRLKLQEIKNDLDEIQSKNSYIVVSSNTEPTQEQWERAFISDTGRLPPIPTGYKFIWFNTAIGFSREYTVINDSNNGSSSSGIPIPSVNPKTSSNFRLVAKIEVDKDAQFPNKDSKNVNNWNAYLVNDISKAKEDGLKYFIILWDQQSSNGGNYMDAYAHRDTGVYDNVYHHSFIVSSNGASANPSQAVDSGSNRLYLNNQVSDLLSDFHAIGYQKLNVSVPEMKDNDSYRESLQSPTSIGAALDYTNATFKTAGALEISHVMTQYNFKSTVDVLPIINRLVADTGILTSDDPLTAWIYGVYSHDSDLEY